jgi:hypothetical protein
VELLDKVMLAVQDHQAFLVIILQVVVVADQAE